MLIHAFRLDCLTECFMFWHHPTWEYKRPVTDCALSSCLHTTPHRYILLDDETDNETGDAVADGDDGDGDDDEPSEIIIELPPSSSAGAVANLVCVLSLRVWC